MKHVLTKLVLALLLCCSVETPTNAHTPFFSPQKTTTIRAEGEIGFIIIFQGLTILQETGLNDLILKTKVIDNGGHLQMESVHLPPTEYVSIDVTGLSCDTYTLEVYLQNNPFPLRFTFSNC